MKTVIICCRTLENELTAAMEKTGVRYPVEWMESGLHNSPSRLNARLFERIARLEADRILLAMGFCGNALPGIVSLRAEIIVPRVDDCISLLLGGMKPRQKVSSEYAAYFLTDGWLKGERNIIREYEYSVEKFGEEEAEMLAEMIYGHYRTLALLDTGVCPTDGLWDQTENISNLLHLERRIIPGTLSRLEELLAGPWDREHYLVIPPGETVTAAHMVLEV